MYKNLHRPKRTFFETTGLRVTWFGYFDSV